MAENVVKKALRQGFQARWRTDRLILDNPPCRAQRAGHVITEAARYARRSACSPLRRKAGLHVPTLLSVALFQVLSECCTQQGVAPASAGTGAWPVGLSACPAHLALSIALLPDSHLPSHVPASTSPNDSAHHAGNLLVSTPAPDGSDGEGGSQHRAGLAAAEAGSLGCDSNSSCSLTGGRSWGRHTELGPAYLSAAAVCCSSAPEQDKARLPRLCWLLQQNLQLAYPAWPFALGTIPVFLHARCFCLPACESVAQKLALLMLHAQQRELSDPLGLYGAVLPLRFKAPWLLRKTSTQGRKWQ